MRTDPLRRLTLRPSWGSRLRAAWFGALLAGTLDLGYALWSTISDGRAPLRMLQSIASGIEGKAAYDGGWGSAGLGVIAHYGILFGIAAVCVDAAMRHPMLWQRPLRHGVVLGIGVYVLMHAIVVPLSAAPFTLPHGPGDIAKGLLVHIVLVGIPMACVVRHVLAKAGYPGRAP